MQIKNVGKKIGYLILASIFSMGAVACNGGGSADNLHVTVWSASNSEKILQDSEIGAGEGKLIFNTFKGDVESAQLIFTPKSYVSSFDFEMCDVKNAYGVTLSKDLFEVYAQKYITVTVPTNKNSKGGYYPDAIVPLQNYLLKREGKVEENENQGLWVNLNVPKDAIAGVYTGTAKLTVNSKKINVPVSVTVYDLDMPEEIHTVSSFYLDTSMIGIGENKTATPEMKKLYYDFLVKKRANARNIPGYEGVNIKYKAIEFAKDIISYAKDPMVSSYALPYSSVQSSVGNVIDYNYCVEVLTELAKKNVELLQNGENVDLFKKAHFYLGALIDEPVPETYPKVRECDLNIQRAKLVVANSGLLDDYPEIKNSLITLKHVVTSKINDLLYGTDDVGGVQTWCPTLDNFSSLLSRKTALERMASTDRTGGEGVWWYTCINPQNPYPSYHIDNNLLSARLMGWMQYDYKIQGNLYWSVNYWQRYVNSKTQSTDVWTEPRSWERANGDGRLIYPGSKYGIEGPISTVRLETIRESNEDYELLWLFEQTINSINNEKSKAYDSDALLEKFYKALFEDVFIKSGVDANDFDKTRTSLLKLLEKMVNDSDGAIAELDKIV